MFVFKFKQLLDFLLTIADTDESNDIDKQKHAFLIYISLLMSVGGIVWGTVALLTDLYTQALIPYSYTFITALNLTFLYYKKNFKLAQSIQMFISLILPFLFQVLLGGFIASGAVILWAILTILVSFGFQSHTTTLKWFALYVFLIIISAALDISGIGFHLNIDTNLSVIFFAMNIIVISSMIFTLFFYFVHSEEGIRTKLNRKINTDSLTTLGNRRYFFHEAEKEFSRSQRYEIEFSLLMIDIDYFKNINDNCGHLVGDKALRSFGKLLKKHARKADIVARYGGEEFVFLLPGTDVTQAKKLAQRIIDNCVEVIVKSHKEMDPFTVSIGLTQFQNDDKNFNETLKRADKALYLAKDNGRNQLQEC